MSNLPARHRLVLLLALISSLMATGCAARQPGLRASLSAAQGVGPWGGPKLLAVYQPWFGAKEHIDVGYSTQDRVVLQRQIEQARNIGIAGFVVNWYGPRKPFMDRSYALLQAQAATTAGFQVAIQYDEAVDQPGHTTDAVMVDLQYAYDHYIGPGAGPARAAYLRYDGRPVIFLFPKTHETDWRRVRQLVQSWEDPPLLIMKDIDHHMPDAFDGFYAWINPGVSGWQANGSNWGEAYLQDFYTTMNTRHPDKIAVGAAWPGFNDRHASWSKNRFMDARCGRTFEDSLRVFRRYYNNRRPLPFLLLETWNDYEEGSAIERGLDTCKAGENGTRQAAADPSPSVGSR